MPGFHRKKNIRKGKGKVSKSRMPDPVTSSAVPQPATIAGTVPQAAAAASFPLPNEPSAPPTAVWSSGQPVLQQPTSIPQAPPPGTSQVGSASQFVFNPVTQTWVS